MTDLVILPDAEKVASAYLRSRSEVDDLIDDRVFTELPGLRQGQDEWRFPAVRITRIGGSPVVQQPLEVDAPVLQVESWGGSKALAHQIAQTCRAAFAVAHLNEHDEAIVYGARFGEMLDLPDEAFKPAKPRYVFDVTLTIRPRQGAGS